MGYLEERFPCDIKPGDIVWADHGMPAIVTQIDSLFPYQARCTRSDGHEFYAPSGRSLRKASKTWWDECCAEVAQRTDQGTWTPIPGEYRD